MVSSVRQVVPLSSTVAIFEVPIPLHGISFPIRNSFSQLKAMFVTRTVEAYGVYLAELERV